jgi:hypothetical protein
MKTRKRTLQELWEMAIAQASAIVQNAADSDDLDESLTEEDEDTVREFMRSKIPFMILALRK